MRTASGRAIIRRRVGQPTVNIVSEDRTFRRQPDGSMLPLSIELLAETENIKTPEYEWFTFDNRRWDKIEDSSDAIYTVHPGEWNKRTFKVTVTDREQAVIVSASIIIEVEEPVEVGGVNLLTRDNWEQGALNKQAESESAYDVLKIPSTTVLRVINLVRVGYNHVYSIGNPDYEYAYINFIGSREGGPVYEGPAYYSEWKDKSSYVRRPRVGNNYVAVMLRKKNGGDITIDDFEKSRLKLENGTVDTDWTPSPSDSWIKYDPATDTLYVEKSFYSTKEISAYGDEIQDGEDVGGGYERLDDWFTYDAEKAGWVLSAKLGKDLLDKNSVLSTELSDKYNELRDKDTELENKYNELKDKDGDKYYETAVNMPSKAWEISHNLNKYPSVTVINNDNQVVIGDVQYIDKNSLTVSFSAEFTGKVICN